MERLGDFDPELEEIIAAERRRQRESIELIASENFVSQAVLEAAGSVLTNKYAEGYPGNRYYGGCEYVDRVEELGIKRVKELFGAEHANLQPHSGSQANMAVYHAALQIGDTLLGMDLTHGGHLTHGSRVNFSGSWYKFIHYGVREGEELIDYNQVESLARKHRPAMIVAGGSAYPRTIDFKAFRQIADLVGAKLMVDMAHFAGLVAADLFPDPVPEAHYVTSTTHKTLRGIRGGIVLCQREFAEDLDRAVFPGLQGGPLMHIIAAKTVGFKEALEPGFKDYQLQVKKNAAYLGQRLQDHGLRLVSGGTDSHLLLIDLTSAGITGQEAEERLERVGITVNKNTIPFETKSPMVTSGIRLGTPAVTTRGMKEREMEQLATLITETLETEDAARLEEIRSRVTGLASSFHLPGGGNR